MCRSKVLSRQLPRCKDGRRREPNPLREAVVCALGSKHHPARQCRLTLPTRGCPKGCACCAPLMSNVRCRKRLPAKEAGESQSVSRAEASSGDLRRVPAVHLRASRRNRFVPLNRHRCWSCHCRQVHQPGREPYGGCPSFGGQLAGARTQRHMPFVKSVSYWSLFRHTAVCETRCHAAYSPRTRSRVCVRGCS